MPRQSRLNVLISGAILAGLAFYAMLGSLSIRDGRNWWHAERYRAECASNLKNLATACAVYANDNDGRDPTSLRQLVPSVLKTFPTCPTVGAFTYTATSPIDIWHDTGSITCTGDHHGPPVERHEMQTMICP